MKKSLKTGGKIGFLDFYLSQAQEIHKTRDFRELWSFSISQSPLKSPILIVHEDENSTLVIFDRSKHSKITHFDLSQARKKVKSRDFKGYYMTSLISRQSAVGEITYISGIV